MKTTANKRPASAKKTTSAKGGSGRKLGALKGKIHLAPDAFTPAEMQPYLATKKAGGGKK